MAFSIVQSQASASGVSGTPTASLTWSAAPTNGNLLVVALTFRGNVTVNEATAQGWIQAVGNVTNGTTAQTEIWYRVAGAGEGTTGPSFNIVAATLYEIVQVEVSGFTGTPTLDKTGSQIATASLTDVVSAAAITAASEFVFAGCGNREGATAGITFSNSTAAGSATIGSPEPIQNVNAAKNGEGIHASWATSGGSGTSPSITFNLSATTNNNLTAGIATFKGVVAAPAVPLPQSVRARRYPIPARRARTDVPWPQAVQPPPPPLPPVSARARRWLLPDRRVRTEMPWPQAAAGGGPCSAAFVQSSGVHTVGTGTGSGGTTNAVTLAGTTAGNSLIACYVTNSVPAGANLGSLDHGFSKIIESVIAGASQVGVGIWMLPNIPGGSITVTLTTPNACDSGIVLLEYSGLGTSPSADGSSDNPINGAEPATFSSNSATETQTGDLIVGLYGDAGQNSTVTVQDGKNSRASFMVSGIVQLLADDQLSSTGLSNAAVFTTPGITGEASAVVVAIKCAAAVAAAVPSGPRRRAVPALGGRRSRSAQPPWPQAAQAQPPALPPETARRRSRWVWLRNRSRGAFLPFLGLALPPQQPVRRRLAAPYRRGRAVEPPWPQAVQPAPPALPPLSVRLRRWLLPDRRVRTEMPWPQAVQPAPPALPPVSARGRRYLLPGHRPRPAERGWPQAVQAAPPPAPPVSVRLRRWFAPPRRARGDMPWVQILVPSPAAPQVRRRQASFRRARMAEPGWPQAIQPPPPFLIELGKRAPLRLPLWPRRARATFTIPFQTPGTVRDVDLRVYTPFVRWTTGMLTSRWRTNAPATRWKVSPPEDQS